MGESPSLENLRNWLDRTVADGLLAVILLRESGLKASRGHFQPIFLRRMPKPSMVVLSTIAVLCGSQNNSMKERVEVGFLCSEPCFRDHLFKFCLDENLFTRLILSPV